MAIKPRTLIFALVTLALSASAGFAVYKGVQQYFSALDSADFEREASYISETALGEAGFGGYLRSLRSIRGLFDSSVSVERNEFETFIEGSQVSLFSSAARIFSFAKRVQSSEAEAFVDSVRKDTSDSHLDLSRFAITPAGARNEYYPTIYVDPVTGNANEVGVDLYADETNHGAIQTAVNTNDYASALILSKTQPILSLFLPVYKSGVAPDTLEKRVNANVGILSARIDLKKLFSELFENNIHVSKETQIIFQEILNEKKNIYTFGPTPPSGDVLTSSSDLKFQGVLWRVTVNRPVHIALGTLQWIAPLGSGLASALLLFFGMFFIFHFYSVKQDEEELVQKLQKEVSEAEHERAAQSGEPIIMLDTKGIITYANKTFCDLLELPIENIIGKNIAHLDSMPESSVSRLNNNFMAVLNGESRPSFELEIHTKNKQILYLECRLFAEYSDTNITHIRTVFKNISERITAQKELLLKDAELSLNEKYLDNIIRGSNVGTWDWNVQTGELKLNERWAEIVGYTLKELEPISIKTWEKVAYPEDLKKSDELLNEHFSHRSDFYALDCRVMHKNGSLIWVADRGRVIEWDAEGKPLRMTGIHVDITDLKTASEKLEKELIDVNKFKMSVDAVEDLVAITDADGIIQYVNHGAEKLTGFSSEELLGKKAGTKENWGGLMSGDYYETLWNTVKLKKLPFHGEVNAKKKSGEHYIASAEIVPILDEHGTIKFFIDIQRDITKEKEVERAKTEFIALASHQLRTPLTTINWYSEMLLGGDLGPVTEKQKKYLDEINNGGKRLANLINALLNVSRVEMGLSSLQYQEIDVGASLQTVIHDHEAPIASKQLKTSINIAPDLPRISLDKKLFEATIQNIISNAIDYTDTGGEVGVNAKKEDEHITISVSDTGIGIPIQDKDRIFEKLYRAENATTIKPDGNGLGLYITKKFLDLIGGSISFISEEHKGSTFTVKIPITQPHETPKSKS